MENEQIDALLFANQDENHLIQMANATLQAKQRAESN